MLLVAWLMAIFRLLYTSDGRRWTGGSCDFNLSGNLWPGAWLGAVRNAMQEWSRVGANFAFIEDPVSANFYTTFDHGTWASQLAFTWTKPASGSSIQEVRTVVNTFYAWNPSHPTDKPRDPTGVVNDLETVLKHELGHALFLGHSFDPNAVMQGTYVPIQGGMPLGTDDIDGIRYLYP